MRICLMFAACLLWGCSSTPETHYYILTSAPIAVPAQAPSGDEVLSVGRIEMPDYLRQRGVVVQATDHQIRAALYHRWGEPLQRGVRRNLGQTLSTAMPALRVETEQRAARNTAYAVDLEILNFHFTENGTALLGGRWTLYDVPSGEIMHSDHFDMQEAIHESGYPAGVQMQSFLLNRLGESIAFHTNEAIAAARETQAAHTAAR